MKSCRYELMPTGKFSSSVRVLFLFLFFASIAIFYYLSANVLNMLGFGNLVFVDGITWLNFIDETMKDGLGGLTDIRSSWFLFILYYPVLVVYNPIYVILLNSFLLSTSANLCRVRVAYLPFIFAIPFFIINALLPNKEILSLLLSVLFFTALSKNKLSAMVMVSLIQIFVRDGVGYAFILVTVLFHLRLLNKITIFIILISLVLIDNYLIDIQSNFELFILERTIGFYEAEGVKWSPYYIRIFANTTNLMSRVPIFTTDGLVSITGVSLFLAGFSILMATVLSLLFIAKKKAATCSQVALSYAFFIVISITSISPLIQPRYMIPVALGYLFNCQINTVKSYYLIIAALAVSLSLRFVYYYMNSLPESTNFWPVDFFIT